MTWQEYERLVKDIYETMGRAHGVKIECYGATCKRRGMSGVDHQIDVLTSHSDGIHTYLTAIECKYWEDKVTKDTVMKSEGINKDCKFAGSVIVSKVGFTPDAILYARSTNVHLVELKERNLSIEGDRVTKIYVHLEITKPIFSGIKLELIKNEESEIEENIDQATYEKFLIKEPGKEDILLKDLIASFINNAVANQSDLEFVNEKISFANGTTVYHSILKKPYSIMGITLTGYNERFTLLDTDYFLNELLMTMKLLFEEKDFVVTVDGRIESETKRQALSIRVGHSVRYKLVGGVKTFTLKRS